MKSGYRGRLFGAVHAEALRRGLDHDALHDMICERCGVHSMSEATEAQLAGIYRQWTGHGLKRRAALPRRGEAGSAQIVSEEERIAVAMEFDRRGLEGEEQLMFLRRQLGGREELRTRGDYARVLVPLREMNAREGR